MAVAAHEVKLATLITKGQPQRWNSAKRTAVKGTEALGLVIDEPERVAVWWTDPKLPHDLRRATGQPLRILINNEYRNKPLNGERVGDGGTADMLRGEINSSEWNGKLDSLDHYQKVIDDQIRLGKIIRNPNTPQVDVSIAKTMKGDLQQAQNEAWILSREVREGDVGGEISTEMTVSGQLAASDMAMGDIKAYSQEMGIYGGLMAEDDE